MGATTYRIMSGYAEEGQPGTEALADLTKVVFSSTLSEPLWWANTQLVTQDAVEAVREMKDNGSKSMRTMGSVSLCRSLLAAGLRTASAWSSFRSSPAAPARTASTTAIPMLRSRWSAAARSTVASSCSSTFRRFWLGRPEPRPDTDTDDGVIGCVLGTSSGWVERVRRQPEVALAQPVPTLDIGHPRLQ
jgi:hypothetical protein